MHESEAYSIVSSIEEIPPDILARFAETRKTITSRSLIPWGEHCTECSWPVCYTTCELYQPRPDGRCQRFEAGMVRIPYTTSLNTYILKITFKRWARLWATATTRLHSLLAADKLEAHDLRIARWIQSLPPSQLQSAVVRKRYSWKKRVAMKPGSVRALPNCMLVECYNPSSQLVTVTFTIRAHGALIPFQSFLTMQSGYNLHRIGTEEIMKFVDLSKALDLELAPNDVSESCTLFFGGADFAIDEGYSPESQRPARTAVEKASKPHLCKCVVWDLDNTIWNGTLIEDGLQGLSLKPGIQDILKQLDERGILISAVSKNNPEDALTALRSFQIADYFLFPQISWMPKSQGIQQIATQLNIGPDSLLFIDDSAFEREQVTIQCPEVQIMDACNYETILNRPDCQTPVTPESKKRRFFYQEQQVRETAHQIFKGDYLDFLRSCELHLTITSLREANMERVHELTQRTNQMNFSGNRYTREQLHEIAVNPAMDTFVLDCADRFGNYGTVGFCIVHNVDKRMTDLMFSCRVQGKRVEHAFVSHVIRKYRREDKSAILADYRKTQRNAASGQVFQDLGFVCIGESNGTSQLFYPEHLVPPDENIVEIHDLIDADVPASVS